MSERGLAIVTGASTGIGLELARVAAGEGYDLLLAADEPRIKEAAAELRGQGTEVRAVQADLATPEGVERVLAAAAERPVDVLCANAGRGLGHGFLEQDPADWRRVLDTNVTGALLLVQPVARRMVARGEGRILFTGSIAGFMPGTFQAVYNGTKAFVDSFAAALRNELKDTGVSVTALMPGPTETEFFARGGLEDTRLGSGQKDDPAKVARDGWEALMKGEGQVISGWTNKLQAAAARVLPSGVVAERHRTMAEPGSGEG